MEENKKDPNKRGFYIALYSTVAVIALIAIGVTNIGTEQGEEPPAVVEAEPQPDVAVNQSPVRSYKETTTESEPQPAQTETKSEPATSAPAAAASAEVYQPESDPEYTLFDDSQEMLWPVNGPIVMDYSVETGVFDKTLEQYRTHDSICIGANVGESVLAAADGVVLAITSSNEKGNMVALDHGNGWCTTYSQIDNINLAEGQIVKQGDIIGCIAQPTKYGSALGSHLDFTVALDKETTDPKLVLKQDE
ncbi:MAG: peptidoglycan DD-metalloendopeptidase family protein [Firmicutes bacterium]|nr:peptidoglycan DD-metalloendopeptidase family protein [Bacillota bacterium]MBQ9519265.1 peptidoglycan DD-metalloendopeptidase family protein [Bacillota bacterium]